MGQWMEGNNASKDAVGLANSADIDQTAPFEQSDLGMHFFAQTYPSRYLEVLLSDLLPAVFHTGPVISILDQRLTK